MTDLPSTPPRGFSASTTPPHQSTSRFSQQPPPTPRKANRAFTFIDGGNESGIERRGSLRKRPRSPLQRKGVGNGVESDGSDGNGSDGCDEFRPRTRPRLGDGTEDDVFGRDHDMSGVDQSVGSVSVNVNVQSVGRVNSSGSVRLTGSRLGSLFGARLAEAGRSQPPVDHNHRGLFALSSPRNSPFKTIGSKSPFALVNDPVQESLDNATQGLSTGPMTVDSQETRTATPDFDSEMDEDLLNQVAGIAEVAYTSAAASPCSDASHVTAQNLLPVPRTSSPKTTNSRAHPHDTPSKPLQTHFFTSHNASSTPHPSFLAAPTPPTPTTNSRPKSYSTHHRKSPSRALSDPGCHDEPLVFIKALTPVDEPLVSIRTTLTADEPALSIKASAPSLFKTTANSTRRRKSPRRTSINSVGHDSPMLKIATSIATRPAPYSTTRRKSTRHVSIDFVNHDRPVLEGVASAETRPTPYSTQRRKSTRYASVDSDSHDELMPKIASSIATRPSPCLTRRRKSSRSGSMDDSASHDDLIGPTTVIATTDESLVFPEPIATPNRTPASKTAVTQTPIRDLNGNPEFAEKLIIIERTISCLSPTVEATATSVSALRSAHLTYTHQLQVYRQENERLSTQVFSLKETLQKREEDDFKRDMELDTLKSQVANLSKYLPGLGVASTS